MIEARTTVVILILALADLGCSERRNISIDVAQIDAADIGPAVDGPIDVRPAICGDDLGSCNPINNVGCLRTELCVIPEIRCLPAGTGGWGALCQSALDCRAGFGCIGFVRGGTMRCIKLCCAGDDESCRDQSGGGLPAAACSLSFMGTALMGCDLPCSPFSATSGCPPDMPYCGFTATGGRRCGSQSVTPPHTVGQSCRIDTDCLPGLICRRDVLRCATACDPAASTDECPTGDCTPDLNHFPAGVPSIGWCQ